MNAIQFLTINESQNLLLLGYKILDTMAKSGQTPLDELVRVAAAFGLQATDIADAIAGQLFTKLAYFQNEGY